MTSDRTDERRVYEAPRIVSLGGVSRGQGQGCQSGTSATDVCYNGGAAAAECVEGGAVGPGDCLSGTTATGGMCIMGDFSLD